ncbi:hypothetical protein ACF0H5_003758 [Mactra antiquata]
MVNQNCRYCFPWSVKTIDIVFQGPIFHGLSKPLILYSKVLYSMVFQNHRYCFPWSFKTIDIVFQGPIFHGLSKPDIDFNGFLWKSNPQIINAIQGLSKPYVFNFKVNYKSSIILLSKLQ